MDITTSPRDTGIYAIRQVGMQRWPAGDSTWQAPGVRVTLMDGRKQLANIKLEVAASKAEDVAQDVADGIEPWVKTLRSLTIVAGLRAELESADALTLRVEDQHWGFDDETQGELAYMAQRFDLNGPLGSDTCRQAAEYLGQQIARGQRLALAYAPDTATALIHPAWELPPVLLERPGDSLASAVAGELLAGWASARDLRDPLITWAVRDAETTRSDVQRITGVSRSTINRLLPEA